MLNQHADLMNPMSIFLEREIESKLLRRAAEGRLLTLRLDIINKCNLQCVMCHYSDPSVYRRKAEYITPEQFETWLESIGKYVREVMLSCADEPLMSKHFMEIISKAAKFNSDIEIGLCTNGMLMTSRIRNALLANGVTFILFSIDGAVRNTVERIRVKSNFNKIISNIKALRDLKTVSGSSSPRIVVDFVMMKSNIHEAVAFVEMAYDLGADIIDFRHAVPSEYWDDEREQLDNYPETFNFYRERILEAAGSLPIKVVIPDVFPSVEANVPDIPGIEVDLAPYYAIKPDPETETLQVTENSDENSRPRIPPVRAEEFYADAYCQRPFTEVMIRNQREVLPCPWHQKVLGHLDQENDLEQIFFGENFAALRASMMRGETDPACRQCPIMSGHLPTKKHSATRTKSQK
ncbi:MAG: radical SAM protein [Xanthomonadales bacterium]|nr:radical SAM protein [Xanthomonadales bacterium]MDH3925440.1 radical SAM protein [Xanthomonadales bacterium]